MMHAYVCMVSRHYVYAELTDFIIYRLVCRCTKYLPLHHQYPYIVCNNRLKTIT